MDSQAFNLQYIAYAIAVLVILWQIYQFFTPIKVKPNAQPEIYKRLEEIKAMRRQRNERGMFNYKDLTKYDGSQIPKVYISLLNDVFDVTNSKDFMEGGQNCLMAGQEVSVNFAKGSGDPQYFFKYREMELTAEEQKLLEASHAAFSANYKKVGTLYQILPTEGNDKKFA